MKVTCRCLVIQAVFVVCCCAGSQLVGQSSNLLKRVSSIGKTSAVFTDQAPVPESAVLPSGSGCGCETGQVSSCNSCCDPCVESEFNCNKSLFGRGFILPSDHAFDCFISPITNPVFFEDPRSLTEARVIFFNHKVPLAAGAGDVRLYALQLRARLSEYVSLIAIKDGFITSTNALIDDGWADLGAGLKFNLLRDVRRQRLLSGGFTFELPTGEAAAFQGNGDGELNLFMSGARRITNNVNWMSAGGVRVPMNPTDESTSAYWSNHLSRQIRPGIYLLSELNWFHWLRSGVDGAISGVEGFDAFNFGSPGVAGNSIVTTAAGMKFKRNRNRELGVAFEFPITEREDVVDNRLTVDWIFRY